MDEVAKISDETHYGAMPTRLSFVKLARCFESLERDPRGGNNIKALKGYFAGSYRYRLGDLRVVYRINVHLEAKSTVGIAD